MRLLLDESLPKALPIAVLVLVVRNNRIESIDPLVPELLLALENHVPCSFHKVGV
jgi:hypothetical protein